MDKIKIVVGALVALAVVLAGWAHLRKMRTRAVMDRLWYDHTDYTAQFIVATAHGLPSAPAIATRLHLNQDQIAAAYATRAGAAKGVALQKLLHEHVDLIAGLAASVVKNPKADINMTLAYQNGDLIADLLAGGPDAAVRAMMKEHLDTTEAFLVAYVDAEWADAVGAHDVVTAVGQHMAAYMTELMSKWW